VRFVTSRVTYSAPRVVVEGSSGYCLFTTKDPDALNTHIEILGRLCAEAWHDDLAEADRTWAEAHRERFGKWVNDSSQNGVSPRESAGPLQSGQKALDKEPVPPWEMLLEAVRSAFFVYWEMLKNERAHKEERPAVDAASRIERTYLWQTLRADSTPEEFRASALRAFRRGFRRGRRGKPSSMLRPIPPMLEPPRYWDVRLTELTGPSAERERALKALQSTTNLAEWQARQQELRELYAGAWREDVPEEDREWAEVYRNACLNQVNGKRRDAIAQGAYEGYLQSSDGLFAGEPAKPWPRLRHYAKEPWRSFVYRVEEASEGESELATAEAAAREYWDTLWKEAPPWDSDPAQAHWLAAVRGARKVIEALDTSKPTEK
jgi:hypothetical protein